VTRIALAVSVAALLGSAHIAAALGPLCCACVPEKTAQTGGAHVTRVEALFCAAAPPADLGELGSRCQLTPGNTLACAAAIPGTSCATALADEGVICPSGGAPVAAPITLLALVLSLAAAGAFATRRRQREN
jgi:hypothetical protein